MGRAVGWADRHDEPRQGPGGHRRRWRSRLAGAGAWLVGALLARIGWPVEVLAAAVLLAQRSLVDHVRAVADALHLSARGRARRGRQDRRARHRRDGRAPRRPRRDRIGRRELLRRGRRPRLLVSRRRASRASWPTRWSTPPTA